MTDPVDREDDDRTDGWAFMNGHWAFMFPEIIPGVGLLIASPIWLVSLLRHGAVCAATCLAIGAVVGGIIMAVGFARRSSFIVHLAVLALVGTGVMTFKLT